MAREAAPVVERNAIERALIIGNPVGVAAPRVLGARDRADEARAGMSARRAPPRLDRLLAAGGRSRPPVSRARQPTQPVRHPFQIGDVPQRHPGEAFGQPGLRHRLRRPDEQGARVHLAVHIDNEVVSGCGGARPVAVGPRLRVWRRLPGTLQRSPAGGQVVFERELGDPSNCRSSSAIPAADNRRWPIAGPIAIPPGPL